MCDKPRALPSSAKRWRFVRFHFKCACSWLFSPIGVIRLLLRIWNVVFDSGLLDFVLHLLQLLSVSETESKPPIYIARLCTYLEKLAPFLESAV